MLVSCVQYSNLIFLQIILPQVIIKYWPYSLFCTLHPCNLLILFLAVFNLLLPPSPILKVKVNQPCPTLCDPMDYRVHEILQARILEWVAYPFSRGSSQPRDWIQVSCMAGRFFPGELQGKLRFKNHQVGSCKGKTVDFNKTLKKKKKQEIWVCWNLSEK